MGRHSRLGCVSIPSLGGGRVIWHRSFSLFLFTIFYLFLYFMLRLEIISNKKPWAQGEARHCLSILVTTFSTPIRYIPSIIANAWIQFIYDEESWQRTSLCNLHAKEWHPNWTPNRHCDANKHVHFKLTHNWMIFYEETFLLLCWDEDVWTLWMLLNQHTITLWGAQVYFLNILLNNHTQSINVHKHTCTN